MTPERYLELLEQDGARLASAARTADLDAPIPACPGWSVRDCVAHTAGVYQHKVACIRLGRYASDDTREQPDGWELVAWFDTALAAIVAELRERGPTAAAYTFSATDQTVGFWYRRMAQETAVHRVDVEAALGATTPIDVELAVDGIDEVLDVFMGTDWTAMSPDEWGTVDPHAGEGSTIAVRSGGSVWRSTLGPERVVMDRDGGPADASVSGAPEDVLLWLWGRHPDTAVSLDGDPSALRSFRDRLVVATQ
jgi:uncharacterized protein (TIGR03083 family)